MIRLAVLRIATQEAAPFVREKLRAALRVAGVRPSAAGEIAATISQAARSIVPTELTVWLASHPSAVILEPAAVAGRRARIDLPETPSAHVVREMTAILSRLGREELLHDLERQVEDRTAELARERERSEILLKNMLPDAIAERMKAGEVIADTHEASVLFADIQGFTAWARDRTAQEVVSILDKIFRNFDDIMRRHDLEKIKTIGDAYLAAAGLPEPQFDHVDRAVLAALDIIGILPQLKEETGLEIGFRVGVHTGPVVAGVIGAQKLFYDIWGDTVNVASRMESHGKSGFVHVSDDVRQRLGDRYLVGDRGVMDIKNRGQMRTWFVLGLAPVDKAAKRGGAKGRGTRTKPA